MAWGIWAPKDPPLSTAVVLRLAHRLGGCCPARNSRQRQGTATTEDKALPTSSTGRPGRTRETLECTGQPARSTASPPHDERRSSPERQYAKVQKLRSTRIALAKGNPHPPLYSVPQGAGLCRRTPTPPFGFTCEHVPEKNLPLEFLRNRVPNIASFRCQSQPGS